MTAFTFLRRRRHRIARLMLAAFVTTWAALAWQPCVHAFDDMQQEPPAAQDVRDCLHCPPQTEGDEAPPACCDEAPVVVCTDIEQSSADGRPAVKLQLPVAITAWLHNEVFADVRRTAVLPVQRDASPRAPHRSLILTLGVRLN